MCNKCEWAVKDLLKKVVHLCPFWDTFNVMKCTYYVPPSNGVFPKDLLILINVS